MRMRSALRLVAVTAAALLLVGCTGLPTSGPPNAGLVMGEEGDPLVLTPIADGPNAGDSPEEIVEGFLSASKTPANSWEIAREFLTDDFSTKWEPEAGVSIDSSAITRTFEGVDEEADDEEATKAQVSVTLDQVAFVSRDGAYSADATGPGKAAFRLERVGNGEWRIADARDGITLDVDTFEQVYERFSLKYFDQNWSHLVSEVRWFPRRQAMATTIARQLISGKPSEWLAPAVRTAFTSGISLVGDAVTVDESQIASVPLTRSALSATSTELSRMRTQLEATLAGVGVTEVRLTVDGVAVDAERLSLDETIVDPGVLVLTDDGFGTAGTGGAVSPVTRISAQIAKIAEPIASVDVSLDGQLAAVQLRDGRVFAISDGNSVQLDEREGLITPTLDPFGYTWTVQARSPHDVQAWDAQVVSHSVRMAWPTAESISHMRISADGTKIAAVVGQAGQRRLVVAAVIRGDRQAPVEFAEVHEVAQLRAPAQDIAWIGSETIVVLSAESDPLLTSYLVGGPAAVSPAPAGAVALSGARSVTGLRVLSSDGSVSAQRGAFWQQSVSDVHVLGTRAGY